MPLIHSKSKKAFKENVETEMKAHPDKRAQDLAIAYSVKRKAGKKKMAEGGPVSAKTEARPGTQTADASKAEEARNTGNKSPKQDSWTSRPDITQSTKGQKTTAIKHPRMVPSNVFSTRLRGEEDHLESSAAPASPDEQPPKHDDEQGADRQGTPPHKMKMMAAGGSVESGSRDMNMADGGIAKEYGKGPEQDQAEHPEGLESDNDQMGDSDAMLDHMTMLAEGGQAEMQADHDDSIAAAIMAKRGLKKLASGGSVESGSSTMNYADGGEVDLAENSMEQPNGYYARNEDAALKENFDEGMDDAHTPEDGEDGDPRESSSENKNDRIETMRKKVMAKRQFKAR